MVKCTHALFNFLFPQRCLQCGNILTADDRYRVCRDCMTMVRPRPVRLCPRCGDALKSGESRHHGCRIALVSGPAFDQPYALFDYTPLLRLIVHRHKYDRDRDMVRLLAERMADLPLPKVPYDYVFPVPLHTAKRRHRGFNQAVDWAHLLVRLRGLGDRVDVIALCRAGDNGS